MFTEIQKKVNDRFTAIVAADMFEVELFEVELGRDELFEAYLGTFPEELRQEHTCHCCKTFLRNYGGVVAIGEDNKIVTLWDFELEGIYGNVPKVLGAIVRKAAIRGLFLSHTVELGTPFNMDQAESGEPIRWDHFYVRLPNQFRIPRGEKSLESLKGSRASLRSVYQRGLNELTLASSDVVIDLIAQRAIYRGEQFLGAVKRFRENKVAYDKLSRRKKELFTWRTSKAGGIRNSAIGTLLIDVSAGMELDQAVAKYESVVAPSNYKRPTSLVTPAMIEKARDDIDALGYGESLFRRHAVSDDINVNNVFYLHRPGVAKASPFDDLVKTVKVSPLTFSHVDEMDVADFIADVLPHVHEVDVMLENRHTGNLMTLIAPKTADSPSMFQWDNGFSWDYKGNMTDSVKERVKRAGGSVSGHLRVSLDWFNTDDLDLHLIQPDGERISFNNRHDHATGGKLDVDMNIHTQGAKTDAVENITFPDRGQMLEGRYAVKVHNYTQRNTTDIGFNVECECEGLVNHFNYPRVVKRNEYVDVVSFRFSRDEGITDLKLGEGIVRGGSGREVWGMATDNFKPVSMIMNSPNHWNGQREGNKHLFFILKDAVTDERVRGFYNEFVCDKLRAHRKVLERVGGAMEVEHSDNQLSGLGFSSTIRANILVRVVGSFNRVLRIML